MSRTEIEDGGIVGMHYLCSENRLISYPVVKQTDRLCVTFFKHIKES